MEIRDKRLEKRDRRLIESRSKKLTSNKVGVVLFSLQGVRDKVVSWEL